MDLASLAGQQSLASLKAATDFGTICRFFEEGRCVKGSACQFLHPEGREGSRRGSSRICYACGSEGHLARDCPRNSVSGLTSLAPPPGPVGIPTPMLGPLDPAALARLPSPMLGPLPTVPGPAVLFNAAAAAHAAAAASASSPFHPAAIAAVTGLEAQAAADREQIRKLEARVNQLGAQLVAIESSHSRLQSTIDSLLRALPVLAADATVTGMLQGLASSQRTQASGYGIHIGGGAIGDRSGFSLSQQQQHAQQQQAQQQQQWAQQATASLPSNLYSDAGTI